jgi:hypothetical protein
VQDLVQKLKWEVAPLDERVRALEAELKQQPIPAEPARPAPQPQDELARCAHTSRVASAHGP